MLDSIGIGFLPDQSLSDKEIINKYGSLRNYYLESARYWSRAYNKLPTPNINKISYGVTGGEVQQILDNFLYFHGVQHNTTFSYMTEVLDESGQNITEISTPYLPGQDIATIIQFLQGQFLGVAASAEPRVDVINPEMKNEMIKKLKMVEVSRKFKHFLDKVTESTGMEFVPPANPQSSTEDVVRTISRSFTSDLLFDAGNILEYVKRNYMSLSDYLRSLTNQLVGRRAAIYVDEDGQLQEVAPHKYFSVASIDDDYGKHDVARGKVNYIHKDAALAKYSNDLTPQDILNIKTMSFYGTELFASFSNLYNYTLFDQKSQFMSEVTVFWRSTIDTGYKVVEDEEDGKRVYKLKPSSKKRGTPAQVIKKATVLANTFVVDYGIYDIIEDPEKQGNRLFPLVVFQPNTYVGMNQSLVDRLKNKQKELDAINQRVRENYTMDLGTILAFNGKKFRDGITPTEIFSQLKKTRFTVATESGEDGDPTNNQPMLQREDVSLMRDIQNYLLIKESFKTEIKEIANVSAMIMGTQTGYIGLKTQQNSAALASNSVQYSFTGVIQLHADAAAIAIEKIKQKVAKEPTRMKWQNLLGEEGVERIKALKDDPYTSFSLSISTRDIIDPTRKQRMLGMLDNLMATGQIDFADWLNVEDAKTMTELKEYARYSVAKKAEMQRVAAMIQQATAQQQTETMAQGQAQTKQVEVQGNMAKQNTINVTKMAQEMIKQGASQEEVAQFIAGAAGGGEPQQEGGMPPEQGGMPPEQGGGGMPPEMMQGGGGMPPQGGQPPMQ